MKKIGIVLGVAAVATITGCKDPDYNKGSWTRRPENEVKNVPVAEPAKAKPAAKPAAPAAAATTAPTEIAVEETKSCTCPPGTKHVSPCTCGASDCKCVVETPAPEAQAKPVAEEKPADAEPATTVYIVQRGDTLSKVSKKFNIKLAAIRAANPSLKGDVIRIGQKLNLPGKVDVGEQKAPVVAKPKKVYTPYTGETKEYVVKSGDTLGAIAYGNGINIRQLKELNGLSSDVLRIGQKLKIPAAVQAKPVAKQAAKPAEAPAAKPAEAKAKVEEKAAAAEAAEAEPQTVDAPEAVVEPVQAASAKPAPEVVPLDTADSAATTYVVQEGDDMTSVSISWGVSAAEIRELNNLGDNDQLVPGQVIKLPAEAQQ